MDEFIVDKRRLRASFSEAAATYDNAAALQREIGDRLLERLRYIKIAPEIVLDCGSGTGHAARGLRTCYPAARVVELDFAFDMLERSRASRPLRERLLRRPSAQFVCGDMEVLPFKASSVDLIASNLALQWANDLDRIFADFRRSLQPTGLLIFSTFGPDTLKELRSAFKSVDGYTHVNRFIDMHDIGDALIRAGFGAPVMETEYLTVTYAKLRDLIQDLRDLGATNFTAGRRRGLEGRRAWQALETGYEAFRRAGRLPATYEVVYGHAWVPAKKSSETNHIIQMQPRTPR